MTASPPLTACIVNFNGAARLSRVLRCLASQSYPIGEVLLVDDASTDGGVELARRLCPHIRILDQPRRRGPGAVRNSGFAAALHDLILFIDNDVFLEPDTGAALVDHLLSQPTAIAVAPRVTYDHRPNVIQYDSADCHFLGLMATRNADAAVAAAATEPTETDSIVTACFLIHRGRWHGGDPFDETFHFNLEDHDFGLHCRLMGHTLWVHPGTRVRHGSGTPGLSFRPGGRPSEERLRCLTANRWMIIGKYYSRRSLVLLSPALATFEVMQWVWLASNGHLRVWWRSVRSLKARWRHLRSARHVIQSRRRTPDREILADQPLPLTTDVRGTAFSRRAVNAADWLLRRYFRLVYRWL